MCKRAFKLARFVLAKRMSNFKTRLNNKLRAYEIMKISFELKKKKIYIFVFCEKCFWKTIVLLIWISEILNLQRKCVLYKFGSGRITHVYS